MYMKQRLHQDLNIYCSSDIVVTDFGSDAQLTEGDDEKILQFIILVWMDIFKKKQPENFLFHNLTVVNQV